MAALIGLTGLLAAFLRRHWMLPFLLAWTAFAVVLTLMLRQPSPIAGTLFDIALLAGLVLSFRFPRPRKAFGNPAADRV